MRLPYICALASAAYAADLTVASLNVAQETRLDRIVADLTKANGVRSADVLMLQEVNSPAIADAIAGKLHLNVARAGELAILSRFPIRDVSTRSLKYCDLRFRCRNRSLLQATIMTPAGPTRVLNTHLDTRVNTSERMEQLAPVVEEAARFKGPAVIGGDFNTNSFYWLGNVVPVPFASNPGAAVRSAMKARGFETPFTDGDITFPALRAHLDWIFASGLRSTGKSIERIPFSDHHAIVATFER